MSQNFKNKLMSLQDNLMNFAYQLTSNRDDALDLLQETDLKVLSNETKYTENTNFKGWVFTIMRNIFINNYRRTYRSAVVVDNSADLSYVDLARESQLIEPESTVSAKEITEAISMLSDENRIPFTKYIAGYKYEEIAQEMGLPLGTVKSRIFHSRKILQETLKEFKEK